MRIRIQPIRYQYYISRAVDPDSHGSAFIFPPGSGSPFNMRIRIQEGKNFNGKLKKCKKIANNGKFIKFFKSTFLQATLFLNFEQSFMFFTTG